MVKFMSKKSNKLFNDDFNKLIFMYYDSVDKFDLLSNMLSNYSFISESENFKYDLEEYEEILSKIESLQSDSVVDIKKIEYYILKFVLLNNSITYYKKLFQTGISKNFNLYIDFALKNPYEILYKHFLYSFRSESSIKDLYEESSIEEISRKANRINDLISDINTIYHAKYNKPFFDTNQALFDLAANITRIVQGKDSFITLLDFIYKGIYEGTDDKNNRIYNDYSDYGTEVIDLIKNYRNYYDHTKDKAKGRSKKVTDFNKSVLGKNLPDKESDYIKLQLELYKLIEEMLINIFDDMNVNL